MLPDSCADQKDLHFRARVTIASPMQTGGEDTRGVPTRGNHPAEVSKENCGTRRRGSVAYRVRPPACGSATAFGGRLCDQFFRAVRNQSRKQAPTTV